jgi:hypothetical protein
MYTNEDLEAAVKAGVLDEASVNRFRSFAEQRYNTQLVDEENFRLISGFNDIFVVIASVLLIVSSAWLVSRYNTSLGFLVAGCLAWWLSVHFVLKKHLALPAIVYLLIIVVSSFGAVNSFSGSINGYAIESKNTIFTLSSVLTMVVMWVHWLQFRVPITVAAGFIGIPCFAIGVLSSILPQQSDTIIYVALFSGVAAFVFAMWWDSKDVQRNTYRSDVAFWLHMLAAPLIVHPVFMLINVDHGVFSAASMFVVLPLYFVFAVVAIIIDRRALMVSALLYVIYAVSEFLSTYGSLNNQVAISGILIGGLLVFLSIQWHSVRCKILDFLPSKVTKFVPAGRVV